ncbi:Holliday junction branch migration protein RuvA [Slackia exigua]|uniref:Holliday junction branch migration protein RuvA n=1 Tax=Slackia exigua TaxID=84109 RepID=UPI0020055599|nr:Holliday junction branch migration protein RuvA [Slackia exigua]MCK6138750.1 Holliday junction branch migration protein RuvA [Slackia exigua]
MIAFLNGVVAGKNQSTAFVDVGGVGFAVGMSANDLSRLPSTGERVLIHTYFAVREDAMTLYGFLSLESKSLFEKLIGVSSVGPKIALAALSTFKASEFIAAVLSGDAAAVSKVPGIGKKMAQRIILELKGSLADASVDDLFSTKAGEQAARLQGAKEALLAMGFTSAEADVALKDAPETLVTDSALLQYALRRLGD